MKLTSLKCPNCNAKIEVEDGLDTFYCKYCGHKIILEGQSDAAYHSKVKLKGMEHDEKMQAQKLAHERYKIETENKLTSKKRTISILLAVAGVLLFVFFFGGAKLSSDKQERELQALVDEIQVDIQNGNYSEAYIKAQSIKYTADWSDDIETKWENTRKEVINQIVDAEIEATGSSNHKREKDGLFDWFD